MAIENKPTGRGMLISGIPSLPVQLDWGGQFSKPFTVAIQSPASISGVFNGSQDVVVEACANADCWIAVTGGSSADATVSVGGVGSMYVSNGRVRQFYVPAANRISVIQNASSAIGNLALVPILLAT